MKGFLAYVLILIFFSATGKSNVFTKTDLSLSKSVLEEIQSFKTQKSAVKNFLKNDHIPTNIKSHIQQCFRFNRKVSGAVFSPTKIFPAKFLKNSKEFYIDVDPSLSNFQIALELKEIGTFSVYSSLLKAKENCLVIEIPKEVNPGADLIVKGNNQIKAIDVDKNYKSKVSSKGVTTFSGIGFGNVTLTVHLKNNKKVDRIIHIHEGITQFFPIKFELIHRKKIKGFELKLMADKEQYINFSKTNVTDFFNKNKLRTSDNSISLTEDLSIKGFKRLVELDDSISSFLNTGKDKSSFTKMNKDFLKYFLKINNFDDLSELCLVHFPVDPNLKDASFIHSTGRQETELDLFYLNKDGSISSSIKKNTHQILVAGYSNGVIDFKFDLENRFKYGQTLCALGTYLIEN